MTPSRTPNHLEAVPQKTHFFCLTLSAAFLGLKSFSLSQLLLSSEGKRGGMVFFLFIYINLIFNLTASKC